MEINILLNDFNKKVTINSDEIIQKIKNNPDLLTDYIKLGYHISNTVTPSISKCSCCDKLDEFSSYLEPFKTGGNSSKNGKLAEIFSSELFQKRNPEIIYKDTSGIEKSGDCILTIEHHLIKHIMIDWKNYDSCIPSDETTKLIRDLDAQNMKFGILFSYRSKICKRKYIDQEIIGDKLIVFISDTGMNIHMVEIAIQYMLKLYEAHILKQDNLVSDLIVKNTKTKISDIFNKLMDINRKQAQNINKIKENLEKNTRMFNDMISNSECVRHELNILLDTADEYIKEIHAEPSTMIHSYTELSDYIDRSINKEKDKLFAKRILSIAKNNNIEGCYSDLDNHIHFHTIGKLNITKTKLTMIFYNKDEENTTYNRKYEIVKNENFHIYLSDESKKWEIIESRFSN